MLLLVMLPPFMSRLAALRLRLRRATLRFAIAIAGVAAVSVSCMSTLDYRATSHLMRVLLSCLMPSPCHAYFACFVTLMPICCRCRYLCPRDGDDFADARRVISPCYVLCHMLRRPPLPEYADDTRHAVIIMRAYATRFDIRARRRLRHAYANLLFGASCLSPRLCIDATRYLPSPSFLPAAAAAIIRLHFRRRQLYLRHYFFAIFRPLVRSRPPHFLRHVTPRHYRRHRLA